RLSRYHRRLTAAAVRRRRRTVARPGTASDAAPTPPALFQKNACIPPNGAGTFHIDRGSRVLIPPGAPTHRLPACTNPPSPPPARRGEADHRGARGRSAACLTRCGAALALAALLLPHTARAAEVQLPDGGKVQKVDFERHVMGLFGRMGCASGSCHGSFQGKG